MAVKISELDELAGGDVHDADSLPIVDASESETKKITVANLRTAIHNLTELPALSSPDDADLVLVHDVETATTKAATIATLRAAVAPASETRIAGFDDFDSNDFATWSVEKRNNATASVISNAAPIGFPGSGAVSLYATADSGSKVQIVRRLTGLTFSSTVPIVVEWRWNTYGDDGALFGAAADNEGKPSFLLIGSEPGSPDPTPVWIGLFGMWDDGTSTRTWALALVIESAALVLTVPVTLPALGAGTGYRTRLTVTGSAITLEAAVDAGPYSVIGTIDSSTPGWPGAVPDVVYALRFEMEKGDGAGERGVVVDWVSWSATRLASATSGSLDDEDLGPGTLDHGALAGLEDDDHPQYLLVDGSRAMTGDLTVAGSVTADDLTVTGSVRAADLTVTGSVTAGNLVPVSRGVYTTLPLTGGGTLSSDLILGIDEATPFASGAMSAADKAKLDGLSDITSGTYTPTITPSDGSTVGSIFGWMWMRIGTVIHVEGLFELDTSTGSPPTSVDISLPVPSDASGVGFVAGRYGSSGSVIDGMIWGEDSPDAKARMLQVGATGGVVLVHVAFTYRTTG